MVNPYDRHFPYINHLNIYNILYYQIASKVLFQQAVLTFRNQDIATRTKNES